MKIVIDISEEDYILAIKNDYCTIYGGTDSHIADAIKIGVRLPKCHGRLIDADSLIKAIEEKAKRLSNADTINGLCGAVALIFDEQTIIPEDKEEE